MARFTSYQAVIAREYNPGLGTAVALFLPLAGYGMASVQQAGGGSISMHLTGARRRLPSMSRLSSTYSGSDDAGERHREIVLAGRFSFSIARLQGLLRRECKPPVRGLLPRFRRPDFCGSSCDVSLGDSFEASALIDAAGGGEFALGPEQDLLVAGFSGEADAFLDQALADSQPAGGRFDQQKTQLGNRRGLLTRNTDPTFSPSLSAIQQRSRLGSKFSTNSATIPATSASKRSS